MSRGPLSVTNLLRSEVVGGSAFGTAAPVFRVSVDGAVNEWFAEHRYRLDLVAVVAEYLALL